MRPLAVAIASNCSFVARGFCGDAEQLSDLIKQGITHKGFALIEVLQNCVSFNKVNTLEWYKQRVYKVESSGYDPFNRSTAFEKALEWGERIPTGVIYRVQRPTYESQLAAIRQISLVRQTLNPQDFRPLIDELL